MNPTTIDPAVNYNAFRTSCSMYWTSIQSTLSGFEDEQLESTSATLEHIIRVLEWVRIEEFVAPDVGFGRPSRERCAIARAFCAKSVLGMELTRDLIERLSIDRSLRRICGFDAYRELPSEATFSRAFAEFANGQVAQRAHEALIKGVLGQQLIGTISRDSTAIEARERAAPIKAAPTPAQPATQPKRGRPCKGEIRPAKELTGVAKQRTQTPAQILAELPTACDHGCKRDAKGFKQSWRGYKLHLDTAECGVITSALVTSASVHDSLAALPLMQMSSQRVTYLYDVADAAYCSQELRAASYEMNHIPLIDHNARGGHKKEFAPHEQEHFKTRSVAERVNAELKDHRGCKQTWVRGYAKVSLHLMLGVLTLSADQIMRLLV